MWLGVPTLEVEEYYLHYSNPIQETDDSNPFTNGFNWEKFLGLKLFPICIDDLICNVNADQICLYADNVPNTTKANTRMETAINVADKNR